MTADEIRRWQERVCGSKHKMGATRARNVAASLRLTGAMVQPYRCPFCAPCWHVGHSMSWHGVERLAELLRQRAHPQGVA